MVVIIEPGLIGEGRVLKMSVVEPGGPVKAQRPHGIVHEGRLVPYQIRRAVRRRRPVLDQSCHSRWRVDPEAWVVRHTEVRVGTDPGFQRRRGAVVIVIEGVGGHQMIRAGVGWRGKFRKRCEQGGLKNKQTKRTIH